MDAERLEIAQHARQEAPAIGLMLALCGWSARPGPSGKPDFSLYLAE
jgi:hypothetical protein